MKPAFRMPQKDVLIISGLAIFNIILHLAFTGNLEYQRDELLYFSLGQHPDFGYATVPPLIGWVAWFMQTLFGYSVFAVRLFPAIISGLLVLIMADLAGELGGNLYARILAATGIIISLLGLRTFFLFQPVHLDLLFWTLTFYIIVKYINSENSKYLLWFGALTGLALLNKYLIGLLFVIIALCILFTKYRYIFREKMFWFGMGLGIIIFLPNLIWQIANGLPVINHLSDLAESQLVNVDRSAFLIDQLIMPGAASFLTVAGLWVILINKQQGRFRFLALAAILVIVILMLMRGKSYYTQGIFPFLISAGAVFYESVFRKWYSRTLFVTFLVLLTVFLVPFGIPVFKTDKLVKYFDKVESEYGFDFGRTFEDGTKHSLPQDYADMLGWDELTQITAKTWDMVSDKKAAFICCENYGQAGAVTIIGKKYGLPEAISFHESFRYWVPSEFNPDITSLVYINEEYPGEDVINLFGKITKVGSISDPHAREYGTAVYLCENPVRSFNGFWKERIKQPDREN